jgi:hypothetical protein
MRNRHVIYKNIENPRTIQRWLAQLKKRAEEEEEEEEEPQQRPKEAKANGSEQKAGQ